MQTSFKTGRDGIEIVDTPGLDDPVIQKRRDYKRVYQPM